MIDKRLSDRSMQLAPCFVYLLVIFTVVAAGDAAPLVVEIGSRRELFVDEFIIDTLQGAQLRLHHPAPREVAITYDARPSRESGISKTPGGCRRCGDFIA